MRTQQQSDNCLKELREIISGLGADTVAISEEVLKMPEFRSWSACSFPEGHHYGDGGLIQHTMEVVSLCVINGYRSNAFGNKEVNQKVLVLAALFHDIGKIYDYFCHFYSNGTTEWRPALHKRTIHHISRSAIFWSKAVERTGLCKDIEEDVLHCILSHHGQREWGSPVAPHSREAWILHLCDGLSARMSDCDRVDLIKIKQ
jgi:3'-5' exoribonuclease